MAGVVTTGSQRQQRALTGNPSWECRAPGGKNSRVVDVTGVTGEDCPSVGGQLWPSRIEGEFIVIKRIVASVFVAVFAVVGASAPAAASTSAATFDIDWQ